ncbi:putative gustatory receptor 28b isoform X1 [Osmia bicornis bicornis]|uniref:putative gustatory receptor 28b isoform X1 n=1 Tax=Osmia bicornis bicornis TaxID=1437191 RepID=UPI001EAF0968|nr:putative gustatory receptor 28b isoform X1 [Osmia bicornis bicornis]
MCRAIVCVLFFFKFIGLATFSVITINRKKKHQKRTLYFVSTKLGTCYNVSIACLIIASNYFTIPVIYYEEYLNKTIVTTAIEIAEGILGSVITFIIVLWYCVNQSIFVKFGNSMVEILEELYRLREPVNRKRIVFILLSIYLFELLIFLALVISDYVAFYSQPISWIGTIVPMGLVSWVFIQYYSVLIVLHSMYANLNKIIQNIYVYRTGDANCLHRCRRVFINSTGIQSLLNLRCIHALLCDISAQVSQFYSLPILLGTFLLFISLLYNVYYFFEPFMVDNVIMKTSIVLNTVVWVIFLLYPLGLLTTRVTKLENEIERTGGIVHALLNYAIDREARTELKLFSLQLLHRQIKFTAIGYFVLDNTLFQSVLSTMTTYLVILIQFQMGGPEPIDCNCNHTCNCNEH